MNIRKMLQMPRGDVGAGVQAGSPSGVHMPPRGTPRTRPGGGRGVKWGRTGRTLRTSGCVCSTCFLEGLCPLPMPGSSLVPGWHLARGWDFHLHVPCWSVP